MDGIIPAAGAAEAKPGRQSCQLHIPS